MMDMEYAHIAGLSGQTIYHEDESPWYFYARQSGVADESKGKKVLLPGENQKTFQKWEKQLTETTAAAIANPLRVFPMYGYAPQRWRSSKSTPLDPTKICGPWNYPFSQIATSKNKGLFVGFKMYNPLGSQPLDPRLPFLHDKSSDGDCFYARCEREGIPILVHCSPGGMTTHEIRYFVEHDSSKPAFLNPHLGSVESSSVPTDATAVAADPEETAIRYFYDNYVHPKAWRKVLEKFRNLKLCLAHFGGDEFKDGLKSSWVTEIIALTKEFPNVYTDLSCWDMEANKKVFLDLMMNKQYSHLHDKLLFGTDWYMTLVALGGKNYRKFCDDAWQAFGELPDGQKLWIKCTFLNPVDFYGFYEKDTSSNLTKLDNIAGALDAANCKKNISKENLGHFKRLQKEYEKLVEDRKKASGS
jgi:predicted TIM-barrel fold metal-dependent hydrolase